LNIPEFVCSRSCGFGDEIFERKTLLKPEDFIWLLKTYLRRTVIKKDEEFFRQKAGVLHWMECVVVLGYTKTKYEVGRYKRKHDW